MRPFSSYIRILDRGYRCDKMQDFLSLLVFRFRTDSEPNLTLIIHIAPAKEMLLGNLLSVHGNGCVSIYFIYPPLPFHWFLVTGWSMDFPPDILHRLVRVTRLFSFLVCFVRKGRGHEPVIPCTPWSPTCSYYGDWRFHEGTSRCCTFPLACHKSRFLRLLHSFFSRQWRITEGRNATRCPVNDLGKWCTYDLFEIIFRFIILFYKLFK